MYPPKEAYIIAIEEACSQLPTREVEDFRSDTSRIFKKKGMHIKPNLTTFKVLAQLREDTSRVALTVDKGVAMVIMDKPDYINKASEFLDDTNSYRVLNKDPTTKIKNKLI